MDATTIALQKQQAILVNDQVLQREAQAVSQATSAQANKDYAPVLTLNAKMMNLGFIMSESLYNTLTTCTRDEIATLGNTVIPILQTLKGSHVQHKPMYPNFPQQVIESDYIELYINALIHYYSAGTWLPDTEVLPREFAFEDIKFQTIACISEAEFLLLFNTLLNSKDSLSASDKAIVQWFMDNDTEQQLTVPDDIPFHENKCLVAAHYLKQGKDITALVKTATDILRIVTYMAEGDVSLAANTKFPSLPRSQRKVLVKQLERVINEEDIGRHRNKWIRLFHNLHVGDYSKKVFNIAKKARNGEKLESFYSRLEQALSTLDLKACIRLLTSRPGEFGRRIDHLLRVAHTLDSAYSNKPNILSRFGVGKVRNDTHQQLALEAFLEIVDAIPTRNLLQLYGHLNTRSTDNYEKIIFPKGSLQRAVIVQHYTQALDSRLLVGLRQGIQASLEQRFASHESLGKVWIDTALIDCPLPSQQRSASNSLFTMARGTRMPLPDDKDTLRLFVYWVGRDIDLSATFHDESGKIIEHVSYTNLKTDEYQAYHSGDITSAPNGASEFIDINITAAAKHARYLAMNVYVYSGKNFAEHDTCFVGWMNRDKPNSNEIYDPATVAQRLDLTAECRNMVPVVFDLHERKAVWTDLPMSRNGFYASGNNVENNYASIQQKLYSILNLRHKTSLYELFEMHAKVRGELVDSREEAETIFSFDEGITPFHVNTINADYVV